MSIDPISTDLTHAFSQSVRESRANQAPASSPADSVTLDTIPASPPPEVFAAMLTAARAADELASSGMALHFNADETSGLSVHLTNLDGTVLGAVSPSTVLSVASGGNPD